MSDTHYLLSDMRPGEHAHTSQKKLFYCSLTACAPLVGHSAGPLLSRAGPPVSHLLPHLLRYLLHPIMIPLSLPDH